MRHVHHYVDGRTGAVCAEPLLADTALHVLYHPLREHAPALFRAFTGARLSRWLGALQYDRPLRAGWTRAVPAETRRECLDDPRQFRTRRQWFERRLRYWECRPMSDDPAAIVSPADARVCIGSLREQDLFFIKRKFFGYYELLVAGRIEWRTAFDRGDVAILRLTPDRYHYAHTPVSGVVKDVYEINGAYHACNPDAVIAMATPFSKNRRRVTVIDTDCIGGTGAGLVALIEIVALMVGDLVPAYSERRYEHPAPLRPGMLVRKGFPCSLFRPGSSTVVLLFQPNRMAFTPALRRTVRRRDVASRFSDGFGFPLVETDMQVRAPLGRAFR